MAGNTRTFSSVIRAFSCAAIIALYCAVAVAAGESGHIYALLSGEWGSNHEHTCESNPHIISFSEDKSRATFSYRYPPASAASKFGDSAEKMSPEHSSQVSIHFSVLDHGKTWIALRREGETILDRLRQPQTWKLSITKDHNGYRWWLYHSVARKKSRMRGIRCAPNGANGQV